MPDLIGIVAYAMNVCQCGHDYQLHINPNNTATGTCLRCVTGNIHAFTADDEITPTVAWPQTLPTRFVATASPTPAGSTPPTAAINNAGGYPVNTTVLTITGLTGTIAAGNVAAITTGPTQQLYWVQAVNAAGTQITIQAPGLRVAVLQSATIAFYGLDGSTPGAAHAPNGQRGG